MGIEMPLLFFPTDITEAFTASYRDFIGTQQLNNPSYNLTSIDLMVQGLTDLQSEFNEDEIKGVIFSLAKEKAVGPDEFLA
jgi:hypothetical protein